MPAGFAFPAVSLSSEFPGEEIRRSNKTSLTCAAYPPVCISAMGIFWGYPSFLMLFLSIRRAEAVSSHPATVLSCLLNQWLCTQLLPQAQSLVDISYSLLSTLSFFVFEDLGLLHILFHLGMAQRRNNKHECLSLQWVARIPRCPFEIGFWYEERCKRQKWVNWRDA